MRQDWLKRGGRPPRGRPALSLALQGGGSFGAFTWGVLDRLLAEEDGIRFEAVSGTSAGAVNAVLLADGLAEGGPEAARRRLARFWGRLGEHALPAPIGTLSQAATAVAVAATGGATAAALSPYQFNPLGLDPLRDLLAESVDFARLRAASPVRLLIAATRVRDGRTRLFRDDEITLEAVLASACLPQLHHAVEIDGEPHWDGGYSANPPLRPLVLETRAEDILLVQVAPEAREGVPRSAREILRRTRELAFGAPLQKELEALEDMAALCRGGIALFRPRPCRRLARLRLHHIRAEDEVAGLARASPLDVSPAFLARLREGGEAAAERLIGSGALGSGGGGGLLDRPPSGGAVEREAAGRALDQVASSSS